MNPSAPIQHDTEDKQFYVAVDGARAYLSYMDLGKRTLDIYRTYVPNALRGKGLAAMLTEHALKFAEERGYTVIPSCSYVERYMLRQEKLRQHQH
ncbi:MAG: GNAT family N-acetyltransferase [Halopseudomonas sp.]